MMYRTRVASGAAVMIALFMQGCGHAPVIEPTKRATLAGSSNDASALAAGETIATTPLGTLPSVLDGLPHSDRASRHPVHSFEPPKDLFERIRNGFKIAAIDHPAIDAQVALYTRDAAYLDRTFRRAERYLHHIVTEIEGRGLPLELALLPVIESAFNPVAYSRSRASGLWQFIPSTGLRYGLKQNWYYDGRRDVLEATRAALDYLQFLAKEFDGDWLLAMAAYNAGEYGVARAIARNQAAGLPTDFFSLPLPRETRAYVPKLLAVCRIVNNPAAYNLSFTPIRNQPYFTTVELPGQLDLNVAAELAELPKEELLALNPAFNHVVTDPEGPHRLLLPLKHEASFTSALANLPPEGRVRLAQHRVLPGETLSAIARRHRLSVQTLMAANNLTSRRLRAGQVLVVSPIAPSGMSPTITAQSRGRVGTHRVRPGETLWSISQKYDVSVGTLMAKNQMSKGSPLRAGAVLKIPGASSGSSSSSRQSASSDRFTYVVRAGDTLTQIANSFRVRLSDLMGWNKLSGHRLVPGQRLVLYGRGRT